jgi:hypothetical protein
MSTTLNSPISVGPRSLVGVTHPLRFALMFYKQLSTFWSLYESVVHYQIEDSRAH